MPTAENQRKIIHCDADCFFAALEMRDDPNLRDKPMAVGGDPGKRGVLSTCNYLARRYGLHSAMASAHALRLCPDLIIVPHRMEVYKEASQVMREIFFDYTDLVEPLSLDEAFLDVSDSNQCQGSATRMAEEIRRRIEAALGITVSAGVAPNKFLAKVASDWQKPNGLTVVAPDQVDAFVRELPVQNIFGVGKVTGAKMQRLGLRTCGDIQQWPLQQLTEHFGSFGLRLFDLSRGMDRREVKPTRSRKSLSVEHTYDVDLSGVEACLQALPSLLVELKGRLRRLDERYMPTKAFVKVKFADFSTTTLERAGTRACQEDYTSLLSEAVRRQAKAVRLLGLGVRLADSGNDQLARQLSLFSDSENAK